MTTGGSKLINNYVQLVKTLDMKLELKCHFQYPPICDQVFLPLTFSFAE